MINTHLQSKGKSKTVGLLDTPATSEMNTNRKLGTATKNFRMLKAILRTGDSGINCFQAANEYHDYVLRSTVTILERKYGIVISREWVDVPNAFGGTTYCKRYWLHGKNKQKALKAIFETVRLSNAK